MALMGAEILFDPTAIANEPQDPTLISKDHWQRTMQGHAAANMVPLVSATRIGHEHGEAAQLSFYGASFIADELGAKVAEAEGASRVVSTASLHIAPTQVTRATCARFTNPSPTPRVP